MGGILCEPLFSGVKTYPSSAAKAVEQEFQLQSSLSLNVSEDLRTDPGSTILHKALRLNFLKMMKIIPAFQDRFRNFL